MRKTKIVCTLGPATNSRTEILKLAQAGMDVARLNFSHGTPEDHKAVLERVRIVSEQVGRPIAVLQDLPGPKIRVGTIQNGSVNLVRGQIVRFVREDILGNPEVISLPHDKIISALKTGADMFLADGMLHLRVVETGDGWVNARVITGGSLGSNKGVNLPDLATELPSATQRDIDFFKYGINIGVDWVAVSFVCCADDARPFREVAMQNNSPVRLLAKVERKSALKNMDSIISAFDGVLVARGDLGIETPIRDVPIVQKNLVKKCNKAGKPVVVATQMLVSMVNSPRPTRAEATDVANAILDGADAVMLSEETAVGKYPSTCVKTMSNIANATEKHLLGFRKLKRPKDLPKGTPESVTDAIGFSAARLAEDIGVNAILTCTASGETARAVSKHRPFVPIIAAASCAAACNQLALSWGVKPFRVPSAKNTDEMIETAVQGALGTKVVKSGDAIIVTAGVRVGVPGNTSLIKYHKI